ncbi:hypothetical protein JHW43_006451 [Diplocarpon mali]|nr:hypothetical protein JHW43_006451 [Diplocarpon mali]
MKVLVFRKDFFVPSSATAAADRDNKTRLPPGSCRRRLSPPLTTTFSRKHVVASPPSSPPPQANKHNTTTGHMACARREAACQLSSEELWSRYSVSTGTSDDDWLMEDILGPDESNPLGNSHSSCGSSVSQLDDEERIWRRYDAPQNHRTISPFYQPTSTPVQAREQGHYSDSRKLPCRDPDELLDPEHLPPLTRCQAVRSPRRKHRAGPLSPPPSSHANNYHALPPHPPSTAESGTEYYIKYHSWPLPDAPLQPTPRLRARANTSPDPAAPSGRPASRPTRLGTCTTFAPDSRPGAAAPVTPPPSACSAPSSPSSPLFAPVPSLMDLMAVETSAFSDDEDDDDVPRLCHRMKTALQLGKASASLAVAGEKLPVEKAKRTKPRRSWSGVLNSLLKGKKGATL